MLLDHFHPPISQRRSWEGFHGLWAAALVEKLNRDVLGDEFFADMQVHIALPTDCLGFAVDSPDADRVALPIANHAVRIDAPAVEGLPPATSSGAKSV
ncbi:MAG: hypothetical protein B7Z73_15740, partial [Planctomycetia bacterium 21-64-5]